MIKISHQNKWGGRSLRFVVSYNEAKHLLKELFEQHLPASARDEDYPEDTIGRVWEESGHWNWFCE